VTAWHVAQLALTCIAVAQLARIALAVAWRALGDSRALADAFAVAIRGRQSGLARAIVVAAQPSWTAQMLEIRGVLVGDQADRLRALAALGRIAGPFAFLAIVLELGAAFGPGHGLAALQRGLVQSNAMERAVLSFAIGVATGLVCTAGASIMREQLRSLSDELKRARDVAARAFRADPDM
jgi:hypothetical protein